MNSITKYLWKSTFLNEDVCILGIGFGSFFFIKNRKLYKHQTSAYPANMGGYTDKK
ncbi:hypothetical protein PI23P_04567 [Polaribacter irgensii 23-P]|uniref:Uncharacterized protein n=1 Tax=Polaribacter irgensii 23-P TaxID=313594 RepID=A4BXQ0_9FLAO|nr:hypothetical protein PI23P_04567 [Polaribacter irgensii 23-P]